MNGRYARRVAGVALAALAVALAGSSAAAPGPQLVDPADDANGGAYWARDPDTSTPVGSQPYADVTSVEFETVKGRKQVGRRTVVTATGFTVTVRLTGVPVPPNGTTALYRVLAFAPGCLFGVDHYTSAPGAGLPKTAIVDYCGGSTRRTPLAAPAISGTSLTWNVPLSALPKQLKAGPGTTLTDLHFEVFLEPHPAACAQTPPGEETNPCAYLLDTTFDRGASYRIA